MAFNPTMAGPSPNLAGLGALQAANPINFSSSLAQPGMFDSILGNTKDAIGKMNLFDVASAGIGLYGMKQQMDMMDAYKDSLALPRDQYEDQKKRSNFMAQQMGGITV